MEGMFARQPTDERVLGAEQIACSLFSLSRHDLVLHSDDTYLLLTSIVLASIMAQIALTTVYTPPVSCFDNSYTSYGSSVYVKDVRVQSSECYPDGFRSLWSLGSPFSPGVCPESYAVVASRSERDVTTVLCCPG